MEKNLRVALWVALIAAGAVQLYMLTLNDPLRIHGPTWPYTDALINYAAGFIRRGFLGTIFLSFSGGDALVGNFNTMVFIWTALGLLLISIPICLHLKKFNAIELTLVALAPGFYLHNLFIGEGFYRKETLFQTATAWNLVLLLLIEGTKTPRTKRGLQIFFLLQFAIQSVVFPLTHEAYIFMAFFVNLFLVREFARDFAPAIRKTLTGLLIIEQFGLFLLCSVFKGTPQQALEVWRAIPPAMRPPEPGAIESLAYSSDEIFELPLKVILSPEIIQWIVTALMCLVFLFVLSLHMRERRAAFLRLAALNFICIFPLFFFGWDFGRWLSCYMTGCLLAYIYLKTTPRLAPLTRAPFWSNAGAVTQKWVGNPAAEWIGFGVCLIIVACINLPNCCQNSFYVPLYSQIPWLFTGVIK